ncbi:ATP-binding protein, partial [candidate division CSSED10-310 bacterium]
DVIDLSGIPEKGSILEIGNKHLLGNVYEHIAALHSDQKSLDQALDFYHKALTIREDIGDKWGIATCYTMLGKTHLKLQQGEVALSFLQKGLQISRQIGARRLEMENLKCQSTLCENQSEFELALFHYKKYHELEQEICRCSDDDIIEITVSDSGIGMDEEVQNKLFEIDKSVKIRGTSGERGTGLGLIICKDFIEKNKGSIRVESEEGRGSSFIFTLPKWVDG